MKFDGRIHVREIEKKAVEVVADQSEEWVLKMLALAAPKEELIGMTAAEWAQKVRFKTSLRVEKMGDDYVLSGDLEAEVLSPCSRCADPFMVPRNSIFNLLLHPVGSRKREKLPEEDSGDADYVFFSSDYVNLLDLLSEQLIVLEPVAECPAKKPDGSCTLCGLNPHFTLAPESSLLGVPDESQNPDNSAGQGVENKAFSAFSGDLKKILKKD